MAKFIEMVSGQLFIAGLDAATVLEEFTYAGVQCLLGRGTYGANGYVVMPWRVRRRVRGLQDVSAVFELPHGVDLVNDREGLIGFHTRHFGDYWPYHFGVLYAYDQEQAQYMGRIEEQYGPPLGFGTHWTLDLVRVRTRQLAEQVHALDYVAPWHADNRMMRARVRAARGKDGE